MSSRHRRYFGEFNKIYFFILKGEGKEKEKNEKGAKYAPLVLIHTEGVVFDWYLTTTEEAKGQRAKRAARATEGGG